MSGNGGKELLKAAMYDAIEATKGATDPAVKGIYALCLVHLAEIEREEKYGSVVKCGPVEFGGWAAVFISLAYLIGKVHGLF